MVWRSEFWGVGFSGILGGAWRISRLLACIIINSHSLFISAQACFKVSRKSTFCQGSVLQSFLEGKVGGAAIKVGILSQT